MRRSSLRNIVTGLRLRACGSTIAADDDPETIAKSRPAHPRVEVKLARDGELLSG